MSIEEVVAARKIIQAQAAIIRQLGEALKMDEHFRERRACFCDSHQALAAYAQWEKENPV